MQGVQVVELLDDSPVKPQSEKSFTIQAGMKKPEPKRKQSINNEFREIFGSDSNSGTFPFHSQTISFTISDTKVREMKAADFGTDSTFPGAPIKFYNLTAKPGCKFTYSTINYLAGDIRLYGVLVNIDILFHFLENKLLIFSNFKTHFGLI